MTKLGKARELFNANPELPKKEMIALMVSELKFPKPMAYNYYGKITAKVDHSASNELIADTTACDPETAAMEKAKPVLRVAKNQGKPLHNVVNMKSEPFNDDDAIPAFLKK